MSYNRFVMETRIRRGGIHTPDGYLFEITGGDVALDFVNTVDSRPTPEQRELLPTIEELLSWARQAGVLTEKEEQQLSKKAKRNPEESEKFRKLAISIRETMFQLFYHVVEDLEIPEHLMAEWNRLVHKSMNHYVMMRTPEGLRWHCLSDRNDFDVILWPIIHSAVQLLTGPNVSRIRQCASTKCDWMFLDTSKRGNRRWCDMTICGNRAKASRFYAKKRKEA